MYAILRLSIRVSTSRIHASTLMFTIQSLQLGEQGVCLGTMMMRLRLSRSLEVDGKNGSVVNHHFH
jgi:hypothetical protein